MAPMLNAEENGSINMGMIKNLKIKNIGEKENVLVLIQVHLLNLVLMRR